MYLAQHDPNLRELNLCELNRPMLARTQVIPASKSLVESVMPDTLTLPLKLSGLVFESVMHFSSIALCSAVGRLWCFGNNW